MIGEVCSSIPEWDRNSRYMKSLSTDSWPSNNLGNLHKFWTCIFVHLLSQEVIGFEAASTCVSSSQLATQRVEASFFAQAAAWRTSALKDSKNCWNNMKQQFYGILWVTDPWNERKQFRAAGCSRLKPTWDMLRIRGSGGIEQSCGTHSLVTVTIFAFSSHGRVCVCFAQRKTSMWMEELWALHTWLAPT